MIDPLEEQAEVPSVAPSASQDRLPSIVANVPACSVEMIVALSTLPVFCATS